MTDIATREPAEIIAGDTLTWQKSLGDYPAGTWTLTYYFRGQAGEFSIVATASGSTHLASVAKATTAVYKAGLYQWQAVVTDGTTRTTVGLGATTVKPDPANLGAGFDPRSHAKKTLEAIEAVIENRATLDQQEYTIGTRSLKRMTVAELMSFRNQYRAEVYAEAMGDAARSGLGSGRVVVRL